MASLPSPNIPNTNFYFTPTKFATRRSMPAVIGPASWRSIDCRNVCVVASSSCSLIFLLLSIQLPHTYSLVIFLHLFVSKLPIDAFYHKRTSPSETSTGQKDCVGRDARLTLCGASKLNILWCAIVLLCLPTSHIGFENSISDGGFCFPISEHHDPRTPATNKY